MLRKLFRPALSVLLLVAAVFIFQSVVANMSGPVSGGTQQRAATPDIDATVRAIPTCPPPVDATPEMHILGSGDGFTPRAVSPDATEGPPDDRVPSTNHKSLPSCITNPNARPNFTPPPQITTIFISPAQVIITMQPIVTFEATRSAAEMATATPLP